MTEFTFFSSAYFIFGLVFGSFLNVLVARLPRNLSVVHPPSACPVCGHKIRIYHNVPVLGYMVLGGKCRDCKTKISIQYPLVELLCGVMFLLVFLKFGLTLYSLKYVVFIFLLLGAGLTDLTTAISPDFECGIIPDTYTIGGTIVGLGFNFFLFPGIKVALIGAAAGFLALWFPDWV